MRPIFSIAWASLLLGGPAAFGQTKNALDGHDEGFIEFFRMAQDGLKDKRTLEQMLKDNSLIRGAGNGDVNAVRKALKAGALVNSYYIDGCAAFGSDGSGYTALMWASDVEVVKLLIAEKADVNLKCINPWDDGETALYRAVFRNNEAIVELLVKAGAKGDPKQIRLGLEMRRAACRGFKLKEGQGYPNYPGNAGGDGLLTIAEVLKKGADINAPDPAGYTPLMHAANLGLVENVKTLLAHGADAKLKTYSSVVSTGGTTALSIAERDSSYAPVERRQVVEVLKAHLADKNCAATAITQDLPPSKDVGDIYDKAVPELAALFKDRKHRAEILPILANSKAKLARTTIQEALSAEDDNDWIFWQARALGLLKSLESKPVLLATIKRVNKRLESLGDRGISFDEPNGLGVMVGGSTDCAHFALIWALGRIEGKEFGTSWLCKNDKGDYQLSGPLDLNDANACILWWREYKKTLDKKDAPANKVGEGAEPLSGNWRVVEALPHSGLERLLFDREKITIVHSATGKETIDTRSMQSPSRPTLMFSTMGPNAWESMKWTRMRWRMPGRTPTARSFSSAPLRRRTWTASMWSLGRSSKASMLSRRWKPSVPVNFQQGHHQRLRKGQVIRVDGSSRTGILRVDQAVIVVFRDTLFLAADRQV